MPVELLDAAGRRRSPAMVPGYRRGCVPRNKGMRFPADPPRVEEIIAVMRAAGTGLHGARIRALVVILWRAGLRINEALMLAETDLEPRRASAPQRSRSRDTASNPTCRVEVTARCLVRAAAGRQLDVLAAA